MALFILSGWVFCLFHVSVNYLGTVSLSTEEVFGAGVINGCEPSCEN